MTQDNIVTVDVDTTESDYVSLINKFYSGYVFKFDTTIDYATVVHRMERAMPDSNLSSVIHAYCAPGTELYSLYGAGTVVICEITLPES